MARSRDLNKQAARMSAPRAAALRKKRGSKFMTAAGRVAFARTPKKAAPFSGTLGTGASAKANAASRAKISAAAKKKAASARKKSQAALRTKLHGTAKTRRVGTSARRVAGYKGKR